MNGMTFTKRAVKELGIIFHEPIVGEYVGNCGGHAYVSQVIFDDEVMVKIPMLLPTRMQVQRALNGVLQAVKIIES